MNYLFKNILVLCLVCPGSFGYPGPNPTFSIIEQDQKKGLVDQNGDIVIPIEYQDLGWSNGQQLVMNELLGYKENGLWGLINVKNQKITPAAYTALHPFDQNSIVAAKKGRYSNKVFYGIINSKGKILVDFKFRSLKKFEDQLVAGLEREDQIFYGLINSNDKIIIPFEYKNIQPLSLERLVVTNSQNKIALFNNKGSVIYGFELDSIVEFYDNLSLVYQEGKLGVMNQKGQLVISPQYKKIEIGRGNNLKVLPYTEWRFLDHNNHLQDTWYFDQITPLSQNLFKVTIGANEVLINRNHQLIASDKNWKINFKESGILIINNNRKFGALNEFGEQILAFTYDSIYYENGYFITRQQWGQDQGWSLWDSQGNKLTRKSYDEIRPFRNYSFQARKGSFWGYLNAQGQEILPFKFQGAGPFIDGKAKVNLLGRDGFIDRDGDWIIKPFYENLVEGPQGLYLYQVGFRYHVLDSFENVLVRSGNPLKQTSWGILEIDSSGKFGLYNMEGIKILDTEYDEITNIKTGKIYLVKIGESRGLVDANGNFVFSLNPKLQEVYPPTEGFMKVKFDDRYGFVDFNGKLRIAYQYDQLRGFSEGMSAVKLRNKWGFLNKIEQLVVQPYYDKTEDFQAGLAIVSKDLKFGLVNISGELMLNQDFDSLYRMKNNRFLAFRDDKVGLIDSTGHILIYPQYDQIVDLDNGYLIVKRKGDYGLMSLEGVNTIPILYDDIRYDLHHDIYLTAKYASWKKLSLPTSQ